MRFSLVDERTDVTHELDVTALTPEAIVRAGQIEINEDDEFAEFVIGLEEELGVLDWTCVAGDLAGFTSSEIESMPELLERFKAWFLAHGFDCQD